MTLAAQRILIIGGGFSGMSAAIELRKHGADVDLVEVDPEWRNYGAGISLGGATLRAFRQLGVLDAFLQQGAASDGVQLRLPHGQPIGELPTPRIAGPDVPGGGAIMRPVLARILADATRASGATVRLGCTFTAIEQDAEGVEVSFTDGQRQRYDLVIGSDGLYSKVREALLPDAPKPAYSGQAVWRAVLPRPDALKTITMWMGGAVKPGVNPVSADELYLFVTERRPTNDHVDPATFADTLRALLAPFPDPMLQALRAQISPASQIVFRPLEGMLVRGDWYRGRVVLIGDTVHATTPHLASGACIGIEDAIVLADELARHASVAESLAAFQARRYERCRMVVDNSARLGQIEMEGGDKDEHAHIMRSSLMALAQPI
ncbi:FAD-dependent oxidoreductase [Ideonella sp. 4Y11]|uniref:FAD-dependent oxidoreductase n=1 Tax=Ideonella aquatica TaxID=2824119 RepID=A0A941BRV7_9BURK|nr:FAD-dependent oxidoreductase [Ideonella aquatica]MBQ0960900.1 FAD-dependent oxidoreductase [Ideonella aquatica]